MFRITNKQILAPDVKRLDIAAPSIARVVKPGQFVVVIPQDRGKWIPLAVTGADPRRGVLTLVFKEIGSATKILGAMAINENIFSVTGPFGNPARIEKRGNVICVASGIGTAQILPICRALKEAGNKVIGIMEGHRRRDLMLEPQMRLACNHLILAITEGLHERARTARETVREWIRRESIGLVYTVGNVAMMEAIAVLAKEHGIAARVQLNPLIQCGRGLCGSCRVNKHKGPVLACQHGPEFDAHELDFASVRARLKALEDDQDPRPLEPKNDPAAKFFPGLLRKT